MVIVNCEVKCIVRAKTAQLPEKIGKGIRMKMLVLTETEAEAEVAKATEKTIGLAVLGLAACHK